jgi:hypothetical protein
VVCAALLLFRARVDQSHPPLAVVELAPFQADGGPLADDTAQASDSIVADMLTHSGLPVIRTRNGSVAHKNSDLRLSGQMRMVGGHLEATLELDDLAQGTLLLSRRFNASPDQAKALPEQIGAFAATALASTGAMMALDPGRAGNRQLTGELLRQWSTMIVFEDVLGAYRSVDRIAGQMPDSAIAQLGLAMTTAHVLPLLPAEDRKGALAKGRSAAARARLLAPNYGDVAWADCTLYSPVRMMTCESALRAAFAIDPNAPFVAAGMRNLLVDVGRYRDALQYDRLAVAAMPYMAGRLSASTMLLEMTGDHVQAERQFQDVRRWWPEFDRIFADRLEGILDRGGVADAAAFVAAMPPDIDIIDRPAVAAIASDVASGNGRGLRSRCSPARIDQRLGQFCLVAMVRAHDLDGAFMEANVLFPNLMGTNSDEEDRLFLERPTRLGLGVLSTAALAPLRQDRRFIQIAQRVGLIRYWQADHLPDFCTQNHEPVCRGFV